ncbi:hypothetical protein JCGZ_13857 [Jatropha curcas]|uniref:Uncharacterized protein n=1 Tax=Jatropha curcas TaxID=180498 RepID=A0A067JVU1_JATCU|nr:hypothetical protein JCGZ_13857 [Jatropha curcas]
MGKLVCSELCNDDNAFDLKGLLMAVVIVLAILATCMPPRRRYVAICSPAPCGHL